MRDKIIKVLMDAKQCDWSYTHTAEAIKAIEVEGKLWCDCYNHKCNGKYCSATPHPSTCGYISKRTIKDLIGG